MCDLCTGPRLHPARGTAVLWVCTLLLLVQARPPLPARVGAFGQSPQAVGQGRGRRLALVGLSHNGNPFAPARPVGPKGPARRLRMPQWEYSKIDLNNVPAKASDLDALDDAGKDGWELVGITANNVAYLKRRLEDPETPSQPRAKAPARRKTAT